MSSLSTLKLNFMLKKLIICATMLGVVFIALASSGGGKKKSATTHPALGLIPIRSNGTFVDTKPDYSGSHVFGAVNHGKYTVYRSVVTYQQGNTTYVVPSQYTMKNKDTRLSFSNGLSLRSNLNMVDLKLRLCSK